MRIRNYQNGTTTAGTYKRDRISVKKIAYELYGYELKQPLDCRFSLDIARIFIVLGWSKNGKKMRLNKYGVQWIYIK